MKNLIYSNIELYDEAPVTFQKIKKKNTNEDAGKNKKKDFCWSQKRGKTDRNVNSY